MQDHTFTPLAQRGKKAGLRGPKQCRTKIRTNRTGACHISMWLMCIYTSTWIFAKLPILIIFGSGTARRPLPHRFIFFSIAFIFPPTSMHFFHNKKKKKLSSLNNNIRAIKTELGRGSLSRWNALRFYSFCLRGTRFSAIEVASAGRLARKSHKRWMVALLPRKAGPGSACAWLTDSHSLSHSLNTSPHLLGARSGTRS